MNVRINQHVVTLTDRDLLGAGGEATVYRYQSQAVKLFHRPDPGLSRADRIAAEVRLAGKIAKLRAFPSGLPDAVIGPQALVTDPKGGEVLGYAMPLVTSGEELRRLAQRTWREGVVSNEQVMTLFRHLHAVLDRLHDQQVVVGDLNGSNILFTGDTPWLIDADSLQFGTYPCPVAHEWFLDPRLYGVELAAMPTFTADNDWYAFSVLLFMSLLYVHPYGGVHAQHPTLLRRAEARHSVLQGDVTYPKAAMTWRVLPEGLMDWFRAVFDQDRRTRFPEQLLDVAWTTCSCGLTHARHVCPACAVAVAMPLRAAAEHHGKCRATSVCETRGRIHAATGQGSLKYLVEEGGIIRRETGAVVMTQLPCPGMRFAIDGPVTWIAYRDRLVQIQHEQVVAKLSCGTFGTDSAFDASSAAAFRLEGDWLLNIKTASRVAQILEGQTWFRTGNRLGFGFYRAGRITHFFVLHTQRPGLKPVALPAIEGRLIDATAAFDQDRVLFQYAVAKEGGVTHHLCVIDGEGSVLATMSGSPDGIRALATLEGKAIVGDRVICATDDGLLALAVDAATGTMTEGTLFVDTEPFVTAGATLLAGPGGSVYVVTTRSITQLTLVQ